MNRIRTVAVALLGVTRTVATSVAAVGIGRVAVVPAEAAFGSGIWLISVRNIEGRRLLPCVEERAGVREPAAAFAVRPVTGDACGFVNLSAGPFRRGLLPRQGNRRT